MKKLTKKEREIINNLDPKCEDCKHYRNHNGRLMCHRMTPFLACKETQRLCPAGSTMNCGTEGRHFSPNDVFSNTPHQARALASRPECGGSPTRESLAEYAHDAWSGWMRYLFGKSTRNQDGTITIPAWAVDRWTRQAGTKYADLPENEKDSDRAEADKMIGIMANDAAVAPTSPPAAGSAFPVGSRWLTPDGLEITVTQYYEVMPGCWRLCYSTDNGGGHMGQSHISGLTPVKLPNDKDEGHLPSSCSPLATWYALVRATDGSKTGAYELKVGDLHLRSYDGDEKKALRWMPIIVDAINAANAPALPPQPLRRASRLMRLGSEGGKQ